MGSVFIFHFSELLFQLRSDLFFYSAANTYSLVGCSDVCLNICLDVCLNVCLDGCSDVCLNVCFSVFECVFVRVFMF
jgi:hypothetical protein